MKLSYITIKNYRSITRAYKIDLSNQTVLIGKNNEGKTNIIRAIKLGMEILNNIQWFYLKKRAIRQINYDWHKDYPLLLQNSKKRKVKETEIRFDFELDTNECNELYKKISSNINGVLSIYISIGEKNNVSVTVPKKGKNASAISNKIEGICEFINSRFIIQYIPAIRSETDAYNVIIDLVESELSDIEDNEYQKAISYIYNKQDEVLKILASKVKEPLQTFLPQIKNVSLYMSRYDMNYSSRIIGRRNIGFDINDGVLTSLSNKGDGVKSLATIALLSQITTTKNRLIIIDEPENHLHPEAIRYINNVVLDLSKNNQVLISTHSPIFVNRVQVKSNIIVENGNAYPANRVDDVRKILGVYCSDNLMYADYVIVVEGLTDKDIIEKMLKSKESTRNALDNNLIAIHAIGGVHNLKAEIYALQRYCCNFLIVLDYDSAGKSAANEIKNTLSVSEDNIRYFIKQKKKETELEDLYNMDIYKEYLFIHNIDITTNTFKNQSKKWSERIDEILVNTGRVLTKELEELIKKDICGLIEIFDEKYFTKHGYSNLLSILEKIEQDINEK